jgi:3,4-dihydroxy 2-butanone 4-phosphate synthase/GTP cyclohydrolase II
MAGLKPAAILCEIMNPDGTMARGKTLKAFAETNKLVMLSINDILTYRLQNEYIIEDEVSSTLFLEKYGEFSFSVIKEKFNRLEHVVLSNHLSSSKAPLIRIHSSCLTGDLFASKRCECNKQLHYSLQRISQEGGMLIYLNQEGRGIGLFNKIKAYALQEQGYDTVDANKELGLPVDGRQYYVAANILRKKNIREIRLLTNNPDKINSLKNYGIDSIVREPMPSFQHKYNQFYLKTKKLKLNHMIDINDMNKDSA